MAHTKGPWESTDTYVRTKNGNGIICKIVARLEGTYYQGRDHSDNARLIAAAPELLEACKNLVIAFVNFGNGGVDDDTVEEVKAAIAKAEGVQ